MKHFKYSRRGLRSSGLLLSLAAVGGLVAGISPSQAAPPGFADPVSYPAVAPVGVNPLDIASADFDGLNGPDLVTVNGNNRFTVYLNQGDGTFDAGVSTPTGAGSNPVALALGDVVGDTLPDVLTVNNRPAGTHDDVRIFENLGGGSFAAPTLHPTGRDAVPTDIALFNFNNDGTPDIAVTDRAGAMGPTDFLVGYQSPGFGAGGVPLPAGSSARAMAAGDLDGDAADDDLVIANAGTDDISVFLSGPNSVTNFPLGPNNPNDIALDDLDGDGNLDAVTANAPGSVSALLGIGDGTFDADVTFTTGGQALALTTGDFDGDGMSDIAVTDAGGSVHVLTNTSTGPGNVSFSSAPWAAGPSPTGVTDIDIEGDGDLDLAVSNNPAGSTSDGVSVIENIHADLLVVKMDSDDPALVGEPLDYTITVSNSASSDTAHNVIVTDTLPAGVTYDDAGSTPSCEELAPGTVTCEIDEIAPGSNAGVTIRVIPGALALENSPITNTVTVEADEVDQNTTNNSDSEDTAIVPAADLLVVKAKATLGNAIIGQPFDYTITVTNAGPNDATNVVLTDVLSGAPVTVDGGSLPAGCSETIDDIRIDCMLGDIAAGDPPVETTITVTPDEVGTITNTVSVEAASPADPDSSTNTFALDTVVDPSADLAIAKDCGPDAIPGGTALCTLTVTNNGPSPATNVQVTDDLDDNLILVSGPTPTGGFDCSNPPGPGGEEIFCTNPTMNPGVATITYTVQVPETAAANQAFANTAVVTSTTHDDPVENNTASDPVDIVDCTHTLVGFGANFFGGPGNEVICGTPGPDRIYAGGGHDVVFGNGGDDRVYGDSGNDRLFGGAGRDRLYGQAGNDALTGNSGDDYLYGDAGTDTASGGSGTNDRCWSVVSQTGCESVF